MLLPGDFPVRGRFPWTGGVPGEAPDGRFPGTRKGFAILCYAILLPGRKSAFRAGIWPDGYREDIEIGSPEAVLRNIELCNGGSFRCLCVPMIVNVGFGYTQARGTTRSKANPQSKAY